MEQDKTIQSENSLNALIILDGWGINPSKKGNAVAIAETPFLDNLTENYPTSKLACSGEAVGLPEGTMGNSEVGHMNIGAGRKVFQDLVRINKAISDKTFFKNKKILDLLKIIKSKNKAVHLFGLLSDGGVHSHIDHVFALIDMIRDFGIKNLYIHPIMDGRDTSPISGVQYIQQVHDYLLKIKYGKIASICGRYYAMDRDTRWDRVEKAYRLYTEENQNSDFINDPVLAVKRAYEKGETDEFIKPVIIKENLKDISNIVKNHDGVIFFNFRADRAKEITRAFTQVDFSEFKRKKIELSGFVCMTQYDGNFDLPVAFEPVSLTKVIGEVISNNGMLQLRLAETEKFAHVTYFFNGGSEKILKGEERILIPSPRDVATYDQKPEMSAFKIASTAVENIETNKFSFIVINFANMDMVGHTGILEAAVKACETVDQALKQVVEKIWTKNGTAFVTADHGNSENMTTKDGEPHTTHTLNPVKFIAAGKKFKGLKLKDGILGDIAPTILQSMNIDVPEEMTGESLIVK
ncbi:MAG: 2,3-bisphosphoglycerate-independent phosphoglycerate mutase [Desulfobacterales bacterium]|nr:2,3-bisphosphoglycerate-independent phosphoglycerate mutase [Desulfobacterales bacterium]